MWSYAWILNLKNLRCVTILPQYFSLALIQTSNAPSFHTTLTLRSYGWATRFKSKKKLV